MKIYKIIGSAAAIVSALAISSCAGDKFYDLGGHISQRVAFKAENLTVGSVDEAESGIDDYSYDYLEKVKEFRFKVITLPTYVGEPANTEENIVTIDRNALIWAGRNNDIKITFTPSMPEEKEVTFFMPDDKIFTVTAANPTFTWTTDSIYTRNTYIRAESRFKKGNDIYENVGFIQLEFAGDIIYNRQDKSWYRTDLYNYDNPLSIRSCAKFTAANLTVGRPDSCVSYNPNMTGTILSLNETLTVPYMNSQGADREYTATMTGNNLVVFGNNEILFTFVPEEGESEMDLTLPDGTVINLTAENPTFLWHVTREDVVKFGYYNSIYGHITYEKNGITYICDGETQIMFDSDLWYDSETKVFRSDYWW